LTALGFSALQLRYDERLLSSAFDFNLRRYTTECVDATGNSKGFLAGLKLRNSATLEPMADLPVKGMFYGIGRAVRMRVDPRLTALGLSGA
jgi:hypothetical protein